ncbi:MAG: hypothetical protein RIB45_11020 [Marivibrio sp.]|uniref:hypothetical protein n=1 Tax=Marivibrio sp. TaxID=2039719 RepID=UPI0032EFCD80
MPLHPFERRVVRFWLTHLSVGAGVAALITGAILIFDFGGLGGLVSRAGNPWMWGLFLYGSLTLSCAPLSVFIALMAGQEDDDP